jgi:hypothetical protein
MFWVTITLADAAEADAAGAEEAVVLGAGVAVR